MLDRSETLTSTQVLVLLLQNTASLKGICAWSKHRNYQRKQLEFEKQIKAS